MVTIDPGSPIPPYEQLRSQLAAQIQAGDPAGGSRLPTVRRLAEDLRLAVNTVARAYRELEAAGFVETRGRNGTVVSWSADAAEQALHEAATAYADRARGLGVDADRAVRMVRAALER